MSARIRSAVFPSFILSFLCCLLLNALRFDVQHQQFQLAINSGCCKIANERTATLSRASSHFPAHRNPPSFQPQPTAPMKPSKIVNGGTYYLFNGLYYQPVLLNGVTQYRTARF